MGTGTSVGRVRGLGSARSGAHHWWLQRVTAAGNLLLIVWLVASLFSLPLHDYAAMRLWLSSPWVATALILATVNVFWHLRLGLQVVLEDYQHDALKVAGLIVLNFYAIGGAALAIFAILRVAFAGAPA